jgi:hypothetical protein
MHFEHYSPFSDSFFTVFFLDLLFWFYLGFRVWFNFSGWGLGELWDLSDLCEDCHPIEVAEHFPVIIFSVPSMMQF